MLAQPLPSQQYLKECFTYHEDTGLLVWNNRPREHFKTLRGYAMWNAKNASKPVVSTDATGYLRCSLDSRKVLVHRVIWKILFNEEPEHIDHINGIRGDNKRVNLRALTHGLNMRNKARYSTNTSGVMGVTKKSNRNGYVARIGNRYIGYFPTLTEAAEARAKAEIEDDYHDNHGRT